MMHRITTTANGAPIAETTPLAPAARCDNLSVGVLITNAVGEYLMFDRAAFPAGVAPAAGHVDDHGSSDDAARAEVAEELGLAVTSLTWLMGGWRANRCRRAPGEAGVGHFWEVFRAEVTGELAPSVRETRNVRWLSAEQLQELAERTVAYSRGELSEKEFEQNPGIEPVWVTWLHDAGLITARAEELVWIDQVAACGSRPAAAVTSSWQEEYPDADWHRDVAPDSVIPLPIDRLQRLDESAAADLIAEADAARAELVRTDTKAGIILAFAGTAFSVLAALAVLASGLAVPARIGLGIAVALLAAASAVALCVIRPALPRRGQGTGFVSHAEVCDVDELLDELAADPETRRAKDVIRLSSIAKAKYVRLRRAVDLMLAALVVVVASLPLGAL
ncbi:Pycsar system effector family protein [Streptosporangium roseum]|uniref:Pycsar system effector family protein n=1 Tax=Streptosporangium roseum TaxID=2001 RepID=UPI00332E45B2